MTLLQLSGEGQAPSPDLTSNENYENMRLLSTLIFKGTRCITMQITMHFSASKQNSERIQNRRSEQYAMRTNLNLLNRRRSSEQKVCSMGSQSTCHTVNSSHPKIA